MHNKPTCEQIRSLLNFYKEDNLKPKLKKLIEEHIEHCENCKKLYLQSNTTHNNFYSDNFYSNLSAYIDNELPEKESIKFKKLVITNPNARKELELMYDLKRAIQNSYEKTKNDLKTDYSKIIMNKINGENTTQPFIRLAWTFVGMVSAILIGFIFLSALYF